MKQKTILWLTTLLVLGTSGILVMHKENILKNGTLMLLKVAPVDPRSIMQGDYMILRYVLANQVRSAIKLKNPDNDQSVLNGQIVVSLTPAAVAQFIRIHDKNIPLAANEHLLNFRKRYLQIRFAAEAWFFQEGHAADFGHARYGEIRVSDNGEAVLTGMRNDKLKPLRHMFKKTASANQ